MVWKVWSRHRVLLCFSKNLLDTKPLVLGDGQVTYLITVDELLGPLNQCLEEVDRVVLIRSQVRTTVDSEKVEPIERVS